MVRVEFLGTAKLRFGVADWQCPARSVADLIRQLRMRFPQVVSEDDLPSHWLLCRNGREFLREPTAPLADGDCVLVLPADAGG